MKKKIFAISDIHSFYTPMKKALDEAGFDRDNPDHLLVVCGDMFDRGPDTLRVLDYIKSLPNKVLIFGNHEHLLFQLVTKMYPDYYDKTNGTIKTFEAMATRFGNKDENGEYDRDVLNAYINTRNFLKEFYKDFVFYYETKNYIFVHSWIPVDSLYNDAAYFSRDTMDWKKDWRDAHTTDWMRATWGNPFETAAKGLNKTGKTIVFGHFHCSYGWYINHLIEEGQPYKNCRSKAWEFEEKANWEPYANKEQGIIGIDRCTAYTGQCNVIIIEDEILEGE